MRHAPAATRPGALVEEATALLAAPALVVVAGGPGSGRSTVLATLGAAFRGPVFAGGGLAMLQAVPAFALTRAVRVRLPAADPALLAEAVRSRVRGGLLLLDDLQWADPATLSALPAIAAHCRVLVALRTPHRLPPGVVEALRAAAAGWLPVPPLPVREATDLARRVAPGLDPAAVTAVVARAGGVPLAVETLARHAAARGTADVAEDAAQVEYAVAAALADLTRPARTAMAALGLLGRPATAAVLGAGVEELLEAGLVTAPPAVGGDRPAGEDELAPVSPYLAEVAAGLLDPPGRQALHRRLASLVPPREAARHLAAAGDGPAAYQVAVAAAGRMTTAGERAELLLLACDLSDVDPAPDVRVAAASAALACGRPRAAVHVLTVSGGPPLGVDAAVLRAEALLQVGDVAAAREAAAPVPDGADPDTVAARDRVLLLARLAEDPAEATAAAARIAGRHGDPPAHAGLRAALAAVRAHARADGWEYGLASATTAAGAAGDLLAARWSAWLLVETLAADGRLAEAAQAAGTAAQASAADLAYSWQTRFLAAELWCTALRGAATDDVVRRAGDLTDRTLPALARGYATAAASLVEADGGLLAPARSRLAGVAAPSALLDWVGREAAWLDGQPDLALRPAHADLSRAGALVAGLHEITARWASADLGLAPPAGKAAVDRATAVAATLEAWTAAGGFDRAAAAWHDLAVREEVRCLLAQGLHESDPALAVPPLLAAEALAEQAGLVVLLGRARRALRRHAVRRDQRGPRAGTDLTDRERDVLRLVAAGEPTRRIAGQLGISGETVETHIRSGMRKLGARTRTEAAARLGQLA
ncbi:LuxR C-terminal-related transcriptional regulator [Phytohabitans sp. LJ34]|uniref:LuxR C-terminal-related transcriptional regulator n=1 Tax=Phytohabitans sp. LJ34 TaxID=3452217 RepID=UPI003F8A6592